MPVMDDFEFLEQFTRLGQTALIQQSVVVITSCENGRDYLKARHWQVRDHLIKPTIIEKMPLFLERHYSTSSNGHQRLVQPLKKDLKPRITARESM